MKDIHVLNHILNHNLNHLFDKLFNHLFDHLLSHNERIGRLEKAITLLSPFSNTLA